MCTSNLNSLLVLCSFLALLSCNNKLQEFRKTKDLSEITGETFLLPQNPKWVILDRDTVVQVKKEPHLVVYLNGLACTPCALKELKRWETAIKQFNEQIIFILQTNGDNEIVKQSLIEQEFHFPVMCDEAGDFARYNLLPKNDIYHVFLLDENNKVFQVGNPLINIKTHEVFKKNLESLNNDKFKN